MADRADRRLAPDRDHATDRAGNVDTEQADVHFTYAQPQPPRTVAASPREAGETVANVATPTATVRDVLIGDPGRDVARLGRHRFTGDGAGTAVAAGGDVNGDGYRDLLIATRRTVHAVFGGPRLRSHRLGRDGLTVRKAGALATRRLGDFAVDGDVDGDGLDDIVIARPKASSSRTAVAAPAPSAPSNASTRRSPRRPCPATSTTTAGPRSSSADGTTRDRALRRRHASPA